MWQKRGILIQRIELSQQKIKENSLAFMFCQMVAKNVKLDEKNYKFAKKQYLKK